MKALLAGLLLSLLTTASASADVPELLLPDEAAKVRGARETVHGSTEALLVVPSDALPARDPRGTASFAAACHVYLLENGVYIRRFIVHAPDAEGAPFARRVGRFMAVAWRAASRRLGTQCGRLRQKPVEVWLTRSGEPGGEQLRNHIYLYDFLHERSGIEWARELTHEWGHYLLPGASGYTEPENWGNGLLGERLFLKWLHDDLRAGRMKPGELPFVTEADLADYRAKQVTPLLERMAGPGLPVQELRRKDRRGMDNFTALLLHADETYGPRVLMDLLDYLPPSAAAGATGEDFLNALTLHLANAAEFRVRAAPVSAAYLPRGAFRVSAEGMPPGAVLKVTPRVEVRANGDGWLVKVATPGWATVALEGGPADPTLRWTRQ
jgi:hypothetical protein